MILSITLVFVNAVFFIIVVYHTRKSGLAILCSSAVSTVGFEGNIGPIFNEIRLRSRMEEAAKFQQVRFISASEERRSSDDVENGNLSVEDDGVSPSQEVNDVSPSQENNDVPPSQQDNDVPSSQEGDDVPLFHEGDVVTPLRGSEGHEMVFVGTGSENQDNARRRSDGERSIVSPISLGSRGAQSSSIWPNMPEP